MGKHMRTFESLGQYHDHWAWVLLSAPDGFHGFTSEPVDQAQSLREAFDELREGLPFVRQKLKDERLSRIAQELIEMSFEAYSAGDKWNGAHTLQECEGMIWKSARRKVKYGVEAERRAFGTNVTYAGVRVSPYPSIGSKADLTANQTILLEMAMRECMIYQNQAAEKAFDHLAWVYGNDCVIRRISPEPAGDDHPVLPPLQKSQRAAEKRLKELADMGQIRACVLVFLMNARTEGVVSYDLEERGYPRISARQQFNVGDDGIRRHGEMGFYLEDPQIFLEACDAVR